MTPPTSPSSPEEADVPTLPQGCILRPATTQDSWPIRRLVLRAMLDPTQIRWQQFWVIEHSGQLVACGQLRQFESAQELGSLVVHPAWRRQGLGTVLTCHLIRQAQQPLYLECLGPFLKAFYAHLGFIEADWETMPAAMQRKFRLTRLAAKLLRLPLSVMEYPGAQGR